jgi:hypothetical protein
LRSGTPEAPRTIDYGGFDDGGDDMRIEIEAWRLAAEHHQPYLIR